MTLRTTLGLVIPKGELVLQHLLTSNLLASGKIAMWYVQDLPERLIFLNGAPGSGKTKALDTVSAFSGVQNAISMSSVISQHRKIAPDALKSMSGLCGDEMACSALAASMRASPLGTRELIVDGFPRSDAQV